MSEQEKGNLKMEDRITNFPQLMQQLDGGVLSNVAGLALSNVARAASASDKKGKFTIEFNIKAVGTNLDMVEITAKMNVTEPKTGHGNKKEDFLYTSMAHIGKGGKLTYDKPKEDVNHQMQLIDSKKLKEVRG